MRRSVLEYVDRVQEEWDAGARTHPEAALLVFDRDGQMVSASAGPDGWDALVGKSLLLWIAKGTFVTPATMDWLAVLSSVTSHVAMWTREARVSGDVLCPHSLQKEWESLFGPSRRTRGVTGRQVRDLVMGLPLVSLDSVREKSTEWMQSRLVEVWIWRWECQGARAEPCDTNELLRLSPDRLEGTIHPVHR